MKKIFIAYADRKMAYSLKRIGKQAEKLKLFDQIILYTPDNLPQYILKSPLMQYSYGGGYWAWKPCIIWETLQKGDEGDIVCYIDAGCTLRKGIEWTLYFELMKEYDVLCFKYRDEMSVWKKFGSTSTKIKCWTKKNLLLFLDEFIGDVNYRNTNKIWGGALFIKGKNNPFLKDWLSIILKSPEVVMDPTAEELADQYPYFAQHKHDQCMLTALAFLHKEKCMVLPELSETCGERVAIYASRIRAMNLNQYCVLRMKYWLRRILGDSLFENCKHK